MTTLSCIWKPQEWNTKVVKEWAQLWKQVLLFLYPVPTLKWPLIVPLRPLKKSFSLSADNKTAFPSKYLFLSMHYNFEFVLGSLPNCFSCFARLWAFICTPQFFVAKLSALFTTSDKDFPRNVDTSMASSYSFLLRPFSRPSASITLSEELRGLLGLYSVSHERLCTIHSCIGFILFFKHFACRPHEYRPFVGFCQPFGFRWFCWSRQPLIRGQNCRWARTVIGEMAL